MISQTKCLLVLLACGWLTLHLVAAADRLPKWKEFICDDAQYEDITERDLKFLVYMDGYLYFFFDNFVLRLDQPFYEKFYTYDFVSYQALLSKVATYISYRDMKSVPSLLNLNPELVSGFIYFNNSEEREIRKWWNLAVIAETPGITGDYNFADYKLDVYKLKLNETQGALGELSDTDALSKGQLHKEKNVLGFVWVDQKKWFEMTYVRDRILFELYEVKPFQNTTFLSSTSIEKLTYLARHAAYYQVQYEVLYSDFDSYLIDVDGEKRIRMQYLRFRTWNFETKWKLEIKERVAVQPFPLTEFLDCDVETIDLRRFKGAFIYKYPTGRVRSFVFADNYYYKSKFDLVKINFKSFGRPEGIQRIQYDDFENRPYSDRLDMKYIKVWKSKFYATFSPHQTYELEFRGQDDDEELVAKHQPDYRMHLCVGSTFTVASEDGTQWWTFCFHKVQYFLLGSQEWEFHPFGLFFIKSIFGGTNVEYGNEDIEEIIWYKEFDRVVFMTYNYLLLFDRSLFIIRQNERGEKYIALTQSGNLTNYSRLRNCFWSGCTKPELPELNPSLLDEENDRKIEREVSEGIKLGNLLLILLFLIGLSCLVWFLVKRRSMLSKELTKEKAKEKLGELKELWQTAKLPDEWKQKLGLSLSKQPTEEAAKKADQPDQKLGDDLKKSKSVKSIGSKTKRASPKLSESKIKQGAQNNKENPV